MADFQQHASHEAQYAAALARFGAAFDGRDERMKRLTVRQLSVLRFLCVHQALYGSMPTRQEISEEFGFRSTGAAEEHLCALERKGAIKLVRGTARGIRLTEAGLRAVPVVLALQVIDQRDLVRALHGRVG